MSCRRVCRELIERFRFGELDASSAPHLDHLRDCIQCRDEIGLDREVVRQLRAALQQRVGGHEPSPYAFAAIRARALAPAPTFGERLWRWARVVPAGAAVALMAFAAVNGSNLAGSHPQATAPRQTYWPGFQERAPYDPVQREWWIDGYLLPSPPATGLIAYADPTLVPTRPQIGSVQRGITK